jgi:hypothetical protein
MAFGVRHVRLTCSGKLKIHGSARRLCGWALRDGQAGRCGGWYLCSLHPPLCQGFAQSAFLPVFLIDAESLGAAAGSTVGVADRSARPRS